MESELRARKSLGSSSSQPSSFDNKREAGTSPSIGDSKIAALPNTPNKTEEKKSRRTSLQVLLPKLPSSQGSNESLNYSPVSPGVTSWLECSGSPKVTESPSPDKLTPGDSTKLTRKESYKAQRKNYRREKKRVADELLNTLKDPSVVVLADWLKVRGTLKSWTKLWCVLKPGLLLLYKSPKTKSSHWVGTVLLNTCQVIERPSKKDGFCFKLFHPLEQSIWSPRGPEKETIRAVVQPLPTAYLIFRAPSQAAGKCWLDALELALRCSSLLVRSMSNKSTGAVSVASQDGQDGTTNHETQWSEADYEKHFTDHDLDDTSHTDENHPENGAVCDHLSGPELSESESEVSVKGEETIEPEDIEPLETPYVENEEEEFGSAGEQTEELAEENKSLIWFLVKQVRPGMDLSKVVLPTFILEPRSFLDKLSDSYYHADILSKAVLEDDAFTRMKCVVKWYLSGLYKKPKGLKKPYNPILGETFRCYWRHANGSRTFYISEQVSHHPPVSAFYVTNRQDGFCIGASILAKSKFYGNSTSAILDGVALLSLLPRGEDYAMTIPYAHCKGILMGTLTMELGGKVAIDCEKTGYRTEIEFKLKPFLGGSEHTNAISGRLKLGKETLATLDGYWDGNIYIRDRRTGEETLLWCPTPEVKAQRLRRYTVPIEHQGEFESERLWQHVAAAIFRDDQVAATEEKTTLEEAQRGAAKERKIKCAEWVPKYFEQDLISGHWIYKHADLRPWDPRNDVFQYEYNFIIQTKTRHKTPMIRTASIVSVDPAIPLLQAEPRASSTLPHQLSMDRVLKTRKLCTGATIQESEHRRESGSSTPDGEAPHSDSSQSDHNGQKKKKEVSQKDIRDVLRTLETLLHEHGEKLADLQRSLQHMSMVQREREAAASHTTVNKDVFIIILVLFCLQTLVSWLFFK